MNRRIILTCCLVSLVLSLFPLSYTAAGQLPQSPRLLRPFQSVTGSLGEGLNLEEWQFEGQPGQMISLVTETISGDLDTVLTLLDPNAQPIASNDNAVFDTVDARLEGIVLAVEGVYTVRVYREGSGFGRTAGEYRLTLLNGYSLGDADHRTSAVINLEAGSLLSRQTLKPLPVEDFYLELNTALPQTTDAYTLEFRFREVPQNSRYWSFQLTSAGEWNLTIRDSDSTELDALIGDVSLDLSATEPTQFRFRQAGRTFFVEVNQQPVAQLDAALNILPTQIGETSILLRGEGDNTENLAVTVRQMVLTSRFYTDDPLTMGAIAPTGPGERIYDYQAVPQQIIDELRASEFIPTLAGGVQAQAVEAFIFTSDLGFSAYPMLGENLYQDYVLGFSASLLEGATDTACGVIFRQQDGANFATMLYTPQSEAYFIDYENGEAAPDGLAIQSAAIRPGLNQENWFVIVAQGEQGSLFINGRLVGEITLRPVAGTFAVHIVISTPEQAYCRLQNVWLWTLGR